MTTNTNKAIDAGMRAAAAERLGNDQKAKTEAMRCGRLAAEAKMTLETIWTEVESLHHADLAWHYLVDAWYDTVGAAAA